MIPSFLPYSQRLVIINQYLQQNMYNWPTRYKSPTNLTIYSLVDAYNAYRTSNSHIIGGTQLIVTKNTNPLVLLKKLDTACRNRNF